MGVLVELLYFPGCPHVDSARRLLNEVLDEMEPRPKVIEIDVTEPETPEHLRGWGSPTVLVDGNDVALDSPSGPLCRIYPGSEIPGVPSLALLRAALSRGSRPAL